MQREIPERFLSADPSLLDQIEIRIAFLTAELEALKAQLQEEKNCIRRRQLEELQQQIEYDMRWACFQKQHLTIRNA